MADKSTSPPSNNGPPPGKPRFAAPQISLPKGGGALRGIGEKFAANSVASMGSLTVSVAVGLGRPGQRQAECDIPANA